MDARDYIVWRNTAGSFGYYPTDANGDHWVNDADYEVWRKNFGKTAGSGSGALAGVPEPASAMLLFIATAAAGTIYYRRR